MSSIEIKIFLHSTLHIIEHILEDVGVLSVGCIGKVFSLTLPDCGDYSLTLDF